MSDQTTGGGHPDQDATKKPDGVGPDGTVPGDPDGIAAGLSDTGSHFNQEEDDPDDDGH